MVLFRSLVRMKTGDRSTVMSYERKGRKEERTRTGEVWDGDRSQKDSNKL